MAQPKHNMSGLGVLLCLAYCFNVVAGSRVGVCYGWIGNDLPSPWEVVELYKRYKIDKMRIYSPREEVLNALRNSGIEVMLGVPNELLESHAKDGQAAGDWVYKNIIRYLPDVRFNYIAVGNERIPDTPEAPFVLGAMKNIYNALAAQNLQDQIKVSTAIHGAVLGNSYPPADGAFKDTALRFMGPIVQFLKETGSPVLFNAYPYFSYIYSLDSKWSIPLNYALFRGGGPVPYQSLFAATVDAMHAALDKVGGGNLEVIVSETGWPSNGGAGASIDNAASYNWNVINHVNEGTPMRPWRPVKTYLFAMFNENQKNGAPTEKYFGLFYPNKAPVYPLDF